MYRTLFAGLLAVSLAVTPAYAAKKSVKKKPAQRTVKKMTVADFERDAWGDSTPRPAKKSPRKIVVKKKPTDAQATVKLNPKVKPAPVAKKTVEPDKTEPTKPTPATVATLDTKGKTAEELEKEAKAQKDPNQALAAYNQILENDPNYAYSGDVYNDMFKLSQRNRSDTLTQLTYAGRAAQALQQGRSRGPVSPKDLQQLERATDDLINRWIEEETRKILAEKNK